MIACSLLKFPFLLGNGSIVLYDHEAICQPFIPNESPQEADQLGFWTEWKLWKCIKADFDMLVKTSDHYDCSIQ